MAIKWESLQVAIMKISCSFLHTYLTSLGNVNFAIGIAFRLNPEPLLPTTVIDFYPIIFIKSDHANA